MSHPRTPEFDRIAKAFGWSADPREAGDDAALLPDGQFLCCDALSEGVHFRFDWSSPADVGWKAVAQNVADIFAMGGLPTQAVWSVGMGRDWTDSDFEQLSKGAKAACRTYGCEIVGGDTVRTTGPGFVSLSLLGRPVSRRPWRRGGARAGDAIVLVGETGWSAAGLEALRSGRGDLAGVKTAVARHRRPRPDPKAVPLLTQAGAHAAIDTSDGLSSELGHLASASGAAMVLDASSIAPSRPLRAVARLLGGDPIDWVLHGGEDHCLLATLPRRRARALLPGIRIVGQVEAGRGIWLRELDGSRREVAPLGWVHR